VITFAIIILIKGIKNSISSREKTKAKYPVWSWVGFSSYLFCGYYGVTATNNFVILGMISLGMMSLMTSTVLERNYIVGDGK